MSTVKIGPRLGLGFGAISILTIIMGIISLNGMSTLADLTNKLYRHPFAVSNAVLQIQEDVTGIRNSLKDLVLPGADNVVDRVVSDTSRRNGEIDESITLVKERFLGPQDDIDQLVIALSEWRDTQGEFIQLANNGSEAMAIELLNGRLSEGGNRIETQISELSKFAQNKAVEFKSSSDQRRESIMLFARIVLLAIVLSSALIAVMITRSLTRPLIALRSSMVTLAEGASVSELPALERQDEIGEMARSVQVFKVNAEDKRKMEAEQDAEKLRRDQERRDLLVGMADDFERNVGQVVKTLSLGVSEVADATDQMVQAISKTNERSSHALETSNSSAANSHAVASASEEMSSSISEIGQQVTESSRMTNEAATEARATQQTVERLADAGSRIGEVIALIEDIASKTNVLALNATIEAARAGDAGKGFAVVAHEVKTLANQTAQATQEIAQQITTIQQSTAHAVGAMGRVADTIADVDHVTMSIASAVEEQDAATREISMNTQRAAGGAGEVSDTMSEIAEISKVAGVAAETTATAASRLSEQSEALVREVDAFLASVRSG